MKKACELYVFATCVALALGIASPPVGQAVQMLALAAFGLRCGWALVALLARAIPLSRWEVQRYQAEQSADTQRSLDEKRRIAAKLVN